MSKKPVPVSFEDAAPADPAQSTAVKENAGPEPVEEKIDSTLLEIENSQLKDKIAEYIEELAELRKANNCKNAKTHAQSKDQTAELNKLKTENEKLRAENDKYLIHISELTFENAKLIAEKKHAGETQAKHPAAPRIVPHMPNMNGYSDWN